MNNIYCTTILDVIIQCELGRELGGQTSLLGNNLVPVSVNDINSCMTILIIIIFSFESNQINLDLLSNDAKFLQISEICCIDSVLLMNLKWDTAVKNVLHPLFLICIVYKFVHSMVYSGVSRFQFLSYGHLF